MSLYILIIKFTFGTAPFLLDELKGFWGVSFLIEEVVHSAISGGEIYWPEPVIIVQAKAADEIWIYAKWRAPR